jgi:hypothetical protein
MKGLYSIYLTAIAICLLVTLRIAEGAPIIILIDGNVIDAAPNEPQYPTLEAECVGYFEKANETLQTIQGAHEKCLNKSENENDTGTLGMEDICSKSACQELHSVRGEMLGRITKAYASCKNKVVEYRYNQPVSSKLIFSHIASSIVNELEGIAKTGGAAILSAKGININNTDELIVDRVLNKCENLISIEDQQKCIKTISDWSNSGLSHASRNAIINKIQKTSMQRIFEINADTIHDINKLTDSIGQAESEGGKTF